MEVQKVGDIPYKEFINEFYKPGIPVVFKNASKVWKANGLFTPDYFRKNFGDKRTVVDDQKTSVEYSMREMLDLIENSSPERLAPYPCIFDIPSQLPELMPLISPLGMNYASPNWFESKLFPSRRMGNNIELFLGGPGGKYPVAHIDLFHTSAWVTQLYGDKNFVVFPRGQDEFMYPKADNPLLSEVNIFNPDYEKHPKFKYATPMSVVLNPGETIYVPFGLWHSAEALSPSISIVFDQMSNANYSQWLKDIWEDKKKNNKARAAAIVAFFSVARIYLRLKDAL